MAKRTHSTVDNLPADLRNTLMRMVTDSYWPDEFGDGKEGRPTYDDCVEYIILQGHTIARSSFARWAKKLVTLELLGNRAEIVRNVMAEETDGDNFADSQRAAADLISARILDAVLDGDLTSKQAREFAAAAKDCMKIRVDNDSYRQKIAERTKAAKEKIGKELKDSPANIQKAVMDVLDEWALGVAK